MAYKTIDHLHHSEIAAQVKLHIGRYEGDKTTEEGGSSQGNNNVVGKRSSTIGRGASSLKVIDEGMISARDDHDRDNL